MQMGQSNLASNNGWSGMLTQNLQPAPGSNPFFNLTAQQQQQTPAFTTQVIIQWFDINLYNEVKFSSICSHDIVTLNSFNFNLIIRNDVLVATANVADVLG